MFQPEVSVVIPAYNAEKYIMQTLESVRDQDYDGMIETVIVDDCSKDGTVQMIREFMKDIRPKRPVIFLQNEKNSGVCAARNAGVKVAGGEYICYLDSDDFWTNDKIRKQISLLAAYEAEKKEMPSIVCTAREMVGMDGQSLGRIIHVPSVITYKDNLKTNLIPCSSVMLKRTTALAYPMERDDLVEDYICWLKILGAGGFAAGIDEPMMKYRVLEGSRSENKLLAAKKHYKALRFSGISAPSAFRYLISYAVAGVRKHF